MTEEVPAPSTRRRGKLRLFVAAGLALMIAAMIAAGVAGWLWLRDRPEYTFRLDRIRATAEYHAMSWLNSYRGEGQEIYEIHCVSCHAKDGSGGRGSDLRRAPTVLTGSPQPLYSIIRVGRTERGMPFYPPEALNTSDAYKLIAHVKTFAKAETEVSGNRKAGEAIYRGKGGCSNCHIIGNEPPTGLMAYDLTGIGGRRSVSYLKTSLVDPNAHLTPEQRPITVVTAAGDRLTGVLLRENTLQVMFRDAAGRIHSYDRAELNSIALPQHSAMPSYRDRLTEAELEDVVAFLQSLR